MNIALAQSEIADFLEQDAQTIVGLWTDKALARSIYVDYRMTDELSHSSIFDVLEHYLREDVLGGAGTDSEVDAWLSAVDELVERGEWDSATYEDLAFALMQMYLDFSGTPCAPKLMAVRATQVMTAYICLLGYVEKDHAKSVAAQ